MATVKLVPKGSQVVILALVILLGIPLFHTIDFYSQGIPIWLPLSLFGLLFITVCLFWFLSHQQVDNKIKQSPELSVSEGNRSTNIVLPQGTLPPSDILKLFETAITSTLYRKKLPVSDGLIDEKGVPVPQSKEEARHIVEKINSQLQHLQEKLDLSISDSLSSEQQQLVPQPNVSVGPQLDNNPEINQIEDNNTSST